VRITSLQKQLHDLLERDEVDSGEESKAVRLQLESLLDQSDLLWRQRARLEWMRGGDRNTKYYHACANSRRRSNYISSVSDVDGKIVKSIEEVQLAFINYFKNLFTSDNIGDMTPCLQALNCRVTEEMNIALLRDFTVEEIADALKSMAPLKAPGPDGFPASFFQKNWNVVGRKFAKLFWVH
jgi:hypothetical protein